PIQPAEARGPQGGPFEPACINYTLANSGPTAIDWTAAADTTWVDVAPADGVLDPGQNATVTVCINHEADLLPAGTHGVSVGFVDTRLGQTQPRSIALNICPLPAVPDLPQPPDGAEYVGFDEPLSWNVGLWEPRRCIPIGRANVSYTSWNRVLASVIAVSQPQTLLEFQVRLRVDADVDLQFLVFEAAARDGPYAPVLTRTVRAMAAGETTYSSGSVHVKLEPGRFYALGLAWGDRAVGFGLEARPCPVEWELGTVEGYISRRLAGSALQPPGGPMAGALLPLTLCVTEGGAVAYDVYLGRAGEAPVPVCAGSPAPDCMPPETLAYDTNYFWQVFSETPCGRTAGPRWSFRTGGCAMFPPLIDRRPGRGPVLRRVHGRYGPFDLDLETPPPGHDVAIESRTGPGSRVVLRFTRPIDGAGGLDPGDVQVIASSWQAVPVLGVAVDRDMLTIDLPELADGHYTVIPAGIVEASNPSCWVYDGVCFAVLTGDADVNGTINSFDLVRVRRNLYGPVDNSTFRSDVNADGQIDGVDLLIVRARLGRQITGFCP
ncbi:MAG TPA: dockerin type I domain-containing protein, partial [Phycisphaerae bacterium]|nr:dockerin type I domain-containing protein [Phycisphaerae bacterium]